MAGRVISMTASRSENLKFEDASAGGRNIRPTPLCHIHHRASSRPRQWSTGGELGSPEPVGFFNRPVPTCFGESTPRCVAATTWAVRIVLGRKPAHEAKPTEASLHRLGLAA